MISQCAAFRGSRGAPVPTQSTPGPVNSRWRSRFRARLLLEVVRGVSTAVGADYPLGVKLNSSDFQKGGFTMEKSREVAAWLDAESIDLLEISSGRYSPDGSGASEQPVSARAQAREAWFQTYAEVVRSVFTRPIMLTGGLRSRTGMESALGSGAADVVGLARPLAFEPDLPRRLIDGTSDQADPLDDVFSGELPRGPRPHGMRPSCYGWRKIPPRNDRSIPWRHCVITTRPARKRRWPARR